MHDLIRAHSRMLAATDPPPERDAALDGPCTRALALHQAAADTAHHHGNLTVHASALIDLGIMRRLSGDLTEAADAFSRGP